MSSRCHYCPQCNKDWHCEGCETRAEERLCESCIEIQQAIVDFLKIHQTMVEKAVDDAWERFKP